VSFHGKGVPGKNGGSDEHVRSDIDDIRLGGKYGMNSWYFMN
jgi:hypothetical protein